MIQWTVPKDPSPSETHQDDGVDDTNKIPSTFSKFLIISMYGKKKRLSAFKSTNGSVVSEMKNLLSMP